MIDEQDLLRRVKQFDAASLSLSYELYSPAIYRYAYHLLGDPDLAEDCLSDTYKRFLQSIKVGAGPNANIKAYLFRIAHNWITDNYRSRREYQMEISENIRDLKPDPNEEIHQQQEKATIREAIMHLTPEQRQVVVLKYIEDYENHEIAGMLKKNIGSVKSLQHRALSTLRKLLAVEER
jgi:RNA polymerase sigma-70 factor (ECF subfamily)